MQKVFKLNKDGKVEFTKEELKKLLDEIYNSGYDDGKNQNFSWHSPFRYDPWYYTTVTCADTNATITTGSSTITTNPYTITYSNDSTGYINNINNNTK